MTLATVSFHTAAGIFGAFVAAFLVLGVFVALDRIKKVKASKRRPGVIRRRVEHGDCWDQFPPKWREVSRTGVR